MSLKKYEIGKNNILVFTAEFPPIIGGLATCSYGICQGLASFGIDVLVLAPYALKKSLLDYQRIGFKVFRYPKLFLLREILLIPYLIYLVFKFRITRIFCVSWYPCGIIAMLNKWLLGTPYAVQVFGSDILKKDVSKSKLRHQLKRKLFWLMRLVFSNARNIFPMSNYNKQLLQEVGAPIEKIKVVNPGVDIARFSRPVDTTLVTERYNLRGKEIMLTVARLEDYKGQDMVIRSLEKVVKIVPNIVYLIVGEGPDEERLKDIVTSSGLEGYVVFIKNFPQAHDELIQLYASSTLFIMVSREIEKRVEVEGFGIVFLEANACEKPVIGGNSGGIADAIVDGQTGLIVNPLDVDAISNAILRLILDKDYADYLGRTGKKRVNEYFTWDKVAMRIWDSMKDA